MYRDPSATMARLALTSVAERMKPLSSGRGAPEDEGTGESGESGETGSVVWCCCCRTRYDEDDADDEDGPGIESAYRSPGRVGLLDDEGVVWYVVRDIDLWRLLGWVLVAAKPSLR